MQRPAASGRQKPLFVSGSLVGALLFLALATASSAAIQLQPVVTSGLSSPIFVGNAGDETNRLFIVEQAGYIRVLQPGSSTPTQFLNIDPLVLSGGERGLLGLAFHPQYAGNGRFFVFYTRDGDAADDGDIVIAEYGVSDTDPDVADPDGTILLTIEHSLNTNHNGGMIAFDFDGYLRIGVGDGGGGNDPPNNAQNINTLLGKILRIDVDSPPALYASPPSNPYAGPGEPGRDEIFSTGWRNPWRFSFDRLTGQQWVADVGQNAIEEVDTPIENGGNYGWRVFEGNDCTDLDPSLCSTPGSYEFPIFEYPHSGGRCSITGGYVYRGTQFAVPTGTYLYGDYCTGEILSWNGTAQVVELDTTMRISSFGEDEQGELYVVNITGGTVSRIVSAGPTATPTLTRTPTPVPPTPTPSNTATPAPPTSTPTRTSTPLPPTATHTATAVPPTSTPTRTSTPLPPTATPTSTPTRTLTPVPPTPTATPCTATISPTSASYANVGGNGSVAVTTGASCAWTAVSNVPWITITGGSSGSGNGTVTYTVAPYGGPPKKRNGTATIAGRTFTVTQTK